MANRDTQIFAGDGIVLTATETIVLGDVSEGRVSRFILWVEDAGSANWSIQINKGLTNFSTDRTRIAGAYVNENAVDTQLTAAITTFGIFIIEAMGMSVELVCTRTAGSLRLSCRRVTG